MFFFVSLKIKIFPYYMSRPSVTVAVGVGTLLLVSVVVVLAFVLAGNKKKSVVQSVSSARGATPHRRRAARVTAAATPKQATEVFSEASVKVALQGTSPVIVFVYADWCGFCKKAMPIYSKLASDTRNAHVTMLKINHTKAGAFVRDHNITGFPSFVANWGEGSAGVENAAGNHVHKLVGFQSEAAMQTFLDGAPGGGSSTRTKGGHDVRASFEVSDQAKVMAALNASPSASPALVFVSADWCGFCKKLIPLWDEVSANPAYAHVTMLRIDAKHAPDMVKQHNIRGFPVLLSNTGQRKYVGFRPKEQLELVVREVGGMST